MDCQIKSSLSRNYKLYVRAYSEAVDQLSAISGSAAKAEWDLAKILADRAWRLCEDARAQLFEHTGQHGC